jgi:hypothetical protein
MLFNHIFLYYYIIKASPRLTLYRLKDKKRVSHLTSPYRLKNYGFYYMFKIKNKLEYKRLVIMNTKRNSMSYKI